MNQSPGMNDCPFCGEALRALAEMFTESVHETWTREEVVNIIEDAIRMGSPLAGPAPSAWQPINPSDIFEHLNKNHRGWSLDTPANVVWLITSSFVVLPLPSSDRGGVGVHRTTESEDAPIGQQKAQDAAP